MTVPTLDIMIVNWNSGPRLQECLRSIATVKQTAFKLQRVVVVDNASWDKSAEGLDSCGLPLTVIQNAVNRGFAVANNQAAEGSRADYLLMLNNDTRLYEDALDQSITYMQQPENQTIGTLSIQLMNMSNHVSCSCARFPKPIDFFAQVFLLDRFTNRFDTYLRDFDHLHSRDVDQAMGAFMLVRRPLYEQIKLDERFFVYYEDVDFALRAKQAGWRTHFYAGAQIFHETGSTGKMFGQITKFYFMRSQIVYTFKHFGALTGLLLTFCKVCMEPLVMCLYVILAMPLRLYGVVKPYARLLRSMFNGFRPTPVR